MKEYLNYNDPLTIASIFETVSNKKQKANDQIKQINEASKYKINNKNKINIKKIIFISSTGGDLCESETKFFKDASMAITFEGRVLTKPQEEEIIDLITDIAHIHIVCIFDKNENTERLYKSVVEECLEDLPRREGQFYRGTLKKRQVLETEKSIIILGDVEFGATVVSRGNIVVLGTIRGTVHAGAAGNKNAFVVALAMKPQMLKIAGVGANRVYLRKGEKPEARIARLDEEHISIGPLKNQIW